MGTKAGTYLGGMRSVDDLRKRCRPAVGCECWIPLTARGLDFPAGTHIKLWVHSIGLVSATQAAHYLAHGYRPPAGQIAYRTCETDSCVNPAHVTAGSRSEMWKLRDAVGNLTHEDRALALQSARKDRTCRARRLVQSVPVSVWALGSIAAGGGDCAPMDSLFQVSQGLPT